MFGLLGDKPKTVKDILQFKLRKTAILILNISEIRDLLLITIIMSLLKKLNELSIFLFLFVFCRRRLILHEAYKSIIPPPSYHSVF